MKAVRLIKPGQALEMQEIPVPTIGSKELLVRIKAAGMPRVPTDFFSNQPLRVGFVSGKPVIYSIGPDGKDDEAQVEWSHGPARLGDFIFGLETPPK